MPKKPSFPNLSTLMKSMKQHQTVHDLEALAANVLNGSHVPTIHESKRLAASVLGKKDE